VPDVRTVPRSIGAMPDRRRHTARRSIHETAGRCAREISSVQKMTRARNMPKHIVEFMCEQREAGRSCAAIARAVRSMFGHHCSESAVQWNCLREGADPPNAKPLKPNVSGPVVIRRGDHQVRHFTPEEDALLLQLKADQVCHAEIGRRLNRRGNSIVGRLLTLARHEARREGVGV
jgi:hypothetical protein